MNYINFKYDLDNVIYYHELKYKFCYDQILYNFNDKYEQLKRETGVNRLCISDQIGDRIDEK